jgi:hypothetical protein
MRPSVSQGASTPGNGSGQPIPPVELLDALVELDVLDADVLLLDAAVEELLDDVEPPEPAAPPGPGSTATLAPHPASAAAIAPTSQEEEGKRMGDP